MVLTELLQGAGQVLGLADVATNEALSAYRNLRRHTNYVFGGNGSRSWKGLPEDRNAIVLLHGFAQGDAAFASYGGLEDFLHGHDYRVSRESYPFWRDLKEVQRINTERVERIYDRTKRKVDLIGHSEGGLVARAVAQERPDLVERVIMLGAPNNGTVAAMVGVLIGVGLTKSARQMYPGSEYIVKLNSRRLPDGVKFFSIYSEHDLLVLPRKSAVLANGRDNVANIPVDCTGHIGLIESRIHPLILSILKDEYKKGNPAGS